MRLLIVEDNRELASWLGKALRQAQYAVDIAHDGEDAEHMLKVASYAVVILDLSLPKIDGLTLLKRLRQGGNKVPVIILTANASLDGRITGLDSGADDYLAKPFEIAELEARIRAAVRRAMIAPHPKSPSAICCSMAARGSSLSVERHWR